MEGIRVVKNPPENHNPFLIELWREYNFPGKPPFAGSSAEERLKEACDKYANSLEDGKNMLPGEEAAVYGGTAKISSSDTARRELHNQIAVMIVGRQRSGMDEHMARNISNFAYEYSRGYKIREEEKYKEKAA